MATTFLTAVSDSLIRAKEFRSAISSFTDTAKQQEIDVMIQVWNEAIDDMMALGVWPGDVAEGSITLVTGTKEYSTETDFVAMAEDSGGRGRFPGVHSHHHHSVPFGSGHHGGRRHTNTGVRAIMINESDGSKLHHYPGGWDQMRRDQLQPSQHTGKPLHWTINPTTGKFELDNAAVAANNGDVYKYIYIKQINLSAVSDTFPVLDDVIDTLIPAVVQLWNREFKDRFDEAQFNRSYARAAKRLSQIPRMQRYGP